MKPVMIQPCLPFILINNIQVIGCQVPFPTNATRDLVKSYVWEPLIHAAYLPDLASFDCQLFASMSHALSDFTGTFFNTYVNIPKWFDIWFAINGELIWLGMHKLLER